MGGGNPLSIEKNILKLEKTSDSRVGYTSYFRKFLPRILKKNKKTETFRYQNRF